MKTNSSFNVKRMTYLALFTALVFVLQLVSPILKVSVFSLSFVLVPIVIAVALCGVGAGPWLGFVFSVAVFVSGDANLFLTMNPFGTIVVVFLKGILAGTATAFIYKFFEVKKKYLAIVLAAITTPVVNTGIFFLGSLIFFRDYLRLIVVVVVVNFAIEFAINLILVPAIYRIIEIGKAKFK